jgi:hypothetical protein
LRQLGLAHASIFSEVTLALGRTLSGDSPGRGCQDVLQTAVAGAAQPAHLRAGPRGGRAFRGRIRNRSRPRDSGPAVQRPDAGPQAPPPGHSDPTRLTEARQRHFNRLVLLCRRRAYTRCSRAELPPREAVRKFECGSCRQGTGVALDHIFRTHSGTCDAARSRRAGDAEKFRIVRSRWRKGAVS